MVCQVLTGSSAFVINFLLDVRPLSPVLPLVTEYVRHRVNDFTSVSFAAIVDFSALFQDQ